MTTPSAAPVLAATTSMDAVTLFVENLDRMVGYYHLGVGLEVQSQEGGRAVLGRAGVPIMILEQSSTLSRAAQGSAGLFHTAILFESDLSLAAAVYSIARKHPRSFTGSSDHYVSEAFYFDDPEGNGVELYHDRPRDSWRWSDGQLQMGTVYLDPNAYLQQHLTEATAEQVDAGAASVGHVHLQVGDIATAREFYVDTLGFEVTTLYGSQALFVSAGGYHHHLGMNTWNSLGAGRRSPALGLGQVSIEVPDRAELDLIVERMRARGIDTRDDGRTVAFEDPWANSILVRAAG